MGYTWYNNNKYIWIGGTQLSYKRKYHPGEKITSVEELCKQSFIYCDGKILNKGWFMSWPLRLTINYINWGAIRYAIKNSTEEKPNEN